MTSPSDQTILKNPADIRARIQEAAGLSLDRLPMLQLIFDRLATACGDGLKHLAASSILYSLNGVETGRFGEFLDAYDAKAVVGITSRPGLGRPHPGRPRPRLRLHHGRGAVRRRRHGAAGRRRARLLGDRAAHRQMVLEQVGRALEASFGLVSKTAFTLERTETRMEFAVIGRRSNKAIQAKFNLQALSRGGEMFIIIPQTVLNPLRPSLAKVLTGETSTRRDPRWTSQIAAEVQKTTVHLRAVLEERT